MKSLIALLALLTPLLGYAQDLDRLRERASQLWTERAAGNKLEALKYVEPSGRDRFSHFADPRIFQARVVGLEFSDVPDQVEVVVRAKLFIPKFGEIDWTVRDLWVWVENDWFLRVQESINPFRAPEAPSSTSAPKPVDFEFLTRRLELGRFTQGATIHGALEFKGDPKEIFLIAAADQIPGLAFEQVTWTGEKIGRLNFEWDTSLRWQDIRQTINFDILGSNGSRKTLPVEFVAGIEGRIRFTQIPELVDPTSAGSLELEVQNLSKVPFRLTSIIPTNPAFVIDPNIPRFLAPGQTGKIRINFPAQKEPSAATLSLSFSEDLLGRPVVDVPLRVKLPEVSGPSTYTQEQLEKIIRSKEKKP